MATDIGMTPYLPTYLPTLFGYFLAFHPYMFFQIFLLLLSYTTNIVDVIYSVT